MILGFEILVLFAKRHFHVSLKNEFFTRLKLFFQAEVSCLLINN